MATAAAGYLAPPLLGLGTAALLAAGDLAAALLLSLVLLAGLALMIRNAYGIVAVVIVVAALALVIWRGTPLVQAAFGSAMAWFLLLGGSSGAGTSAVPAPVPGAADRRGSAGPAHRRPCWRLGHPVCAGGRGALVLSAAWLVF